METTTYIHTRTHTNTHTHTHARTRTPSTHVKKMKYLQSKKPWKLLESKKHDHLPKDVGTKRKLDKNWKTHAERMQNCPNVASLLADKREVERERQRRG